MNTAKGLLEDINTFLSTNNVDSATLDFLIDLKQKILKSCDFTAMKSGQNITDIEKILRSIGKKAFVDCFDVFKQARDGDSLDIVSMMHKCGGAKNDNSARTKASIGKRIFKEHIELEALKNIIGSAKVDEETKDKALKILHREGGKK